MTGQTVGHYVIGRRLGSGGMGVVYEAEDRRLGRRVAIKFLPEEALSDAEAAERFLREARASSSLNHPHICTLHDIGEHDGQQYMVMELLEGEPLSSRVARGPLPIEEVIDYGGQVADALDAAHASGIVHRDLKPANLFITRRGQMKVLDFGVAKLARTGQDSASAETMAISDQLTTLGSAIGTIHYMSPEQARGQDTDGRSDIFSLGSVLYEMATGQPAFPGATPAVVFEGILTKTPAPASDLVAGIPPEFDRIVYRALEKDRDVRYQSAADLRAELKRLRQATDRSRTIATPAAVGATPSGTAPSPARRRLAWLVAAPVVTALVVAGILFWRSARTPALTSRDTVILSSFDNRTGDAMFDDTLGEALAMQLRQSPFLNLLNDQQQQATLRQMGRDPMSAVTPDVGREICQRNGGRALLGGSIASLGSSYLLTLNAQDCVTGDVLAEEQTQAANKDEVLGALGAASSRFREKLGESLASIQRYDAKIEQATTPSLDALKSYSQGVLQRRTEGDASSVPFFQRAIEQDPQFALAYARLGTVYSNLNQRQDAVEMTTRAYELRDRVSEIERLYIEARYNSVVTRDTEKAIETYRVLLATFPNDYAAHTNLGALLKERGEIEAALAELQEAVRLAPEQPTGWLNLGHTYIDQRSYEEARTALERGLALVDSAGARSGLFVLGVVTGDQALADAQVEAMKGRRDEADLLPARAFGAAYRGRLREAAELMTQLRRTAEQAGREVSTREVYLALGIDEALAGLPDRARARVSELEREQRLTGEIGDERLILAAIMVDPPMARAAFEDALAGLSETSDRRTVDEPLLRALLALGTGDPEEAARLLTPVTFARRFTDQVSTWAFSQGRLGNHRAALDALTWLDETPSPIRMGVMPAHVLVQRARAHMALGETDAARRAYDRFFDLWKDADEDIPLLVEARKEYEKLGT